MPHPLRATSFPGMVPCLPSGCTLRSWALGEAMAALRKLGGSISAESGLTPRRSFSRNILRHEGDRLNVLVLSWGEGGKSHSQP